nr:integrase, catalytic region, zinc finger, CCHC-type, peptidase aspartic, catalytic [Tanacetum cinerariifolium]
MLLHADDICLLFLESSKFLWCSSTSASLFLLQLLLDAEGTLSCFVLLLGYGLLVLVLSTPVEDKPFKSEFTSFLVMTGGCETVIGFVLALSLTVLGTCFSSLEVLKGFILNISGAITLSLFTPLDSCGVETEFEDSSKNTKFAKQPNVEILPKIGETNALSKPVTSNSVSTPQVSKGVNNAKVIAPGMFRISPDKVSREAKKVPNTVSASSRTKPITVSQPSVITKKNVNSDLNGLSSAGLDNTKTRRPQPRSNTKIDRVPSASKSNRSKNKEAKVEAYHRNLLLSKNNEHMSSACNNFKLDSQDVISKVVCAVCKKCLNSVNHDVCLNNYVNGKKSRGRKHQVNVSKNETQQKSQPEIIKPKKDIKSKVICAKCKKCLNYVNHDVCLNNCVNGKKSRGCFKHMTGNLKLLINFVWKFMGTVRFGNDHVAAILGFGDLQWGNILITRVYFVEGLGYNLFSVC